MGKARASWDPRGGSWDPHQFHPLPNIPPAGRRVPAVEAHALSHGAAVLAQDPEKPEEEIQGGAARDAAWPLPDASQVSGSELQPQRDPERGF